jgi:hypothetical protein
MKGFFIKTLSFLFKILKIYSNAKEKDFYPIVILI